MWPEREKRISYITGSRESGLEQGDVSKVVKSGTSLKGVPENKNSVISINNS